LKDGGSRELPFDAQAPVLQQRESAAVEGSVDVTADQIARRADVSGSERIVKIPCRRRIGSRWGSAKIDVGAGRPSRVGNAAAAVGGVDESVAAADHSLLVESIGKADARREIAVCGWGLVPPVSVHSCEYQRSRKTKDGVGCLGIEPREFVVAVGKAGQNVVPDSKIQRQLPCQLPIVVEIGVEVLLRGGDRGILGDLAATRESE
jgi:hypothetical protein